MADDDDIAKDKHPAHLTAFEDAQATVDWVFHRAMEQGEVNAYERFVSFAERLRRFSMVNTMLIYAQRPEASIVGTRTQWLNVDRTVKPDAVPIVTLRPFGPVEFNFDVGDTEGVHIDERAGDPFRARRGARSMDIQKVLRAANSFGVDFRVSASDQSIFVGKVTTSPCNDESEMLFEEFGSGGIDLDRPRLKDTPDQKIYWRVHVRRHSSDPRGQSALYHGLGHLYCGHFGNVAGREWFDRGNLPDAVKELEAKTVSNLVYFRNALYPKQQHYLDPLVTPENVRGISPFVIMSAANRIELRSYLPKPPSSSDRRGPPFQPRGVVL